VSLEGGYNVRRRTFCAVGLTAIAASSIPFGRVRAGSSGSEIAAKGLDGRELALNAADGEDLRAGLRGELIELARASGVIGSLSITTLIGSAESVTELK